MEYPEKDVLSLTRSPAPDISATARKKALAAREEQAALASIYPYVSHLLNVESVSTSRVNKCIYLARRERKPDPSAHQPRQQRNVPTVSVIYFTQRALSAEPRSHKKLQPNKSKPQASNNSIDLMLLNQLTNNRLF